MILESEDILAVCHNVKSLFKDKDVILKSG